MLSWWRHRQEQARLVRNSVDTLMFSFGREAYGEARMRAVFAMRERSESGDRAAAHWQNVRAEIGRRTGRKVGLDTATRMWMAARDEGQL